MSREVWKLDLLLYICGYLDVYKLGLRIVGSTTTKGVTKAVYIMIGVTLLVLNVQVEFL